MADKDDSYHTKIQNIFRFLESRATEVPADELIRWAIKLLPYYGIDRAVRWEIFAQGGHIQRVQIKFFAGVT